MRGIVASSLLTAVLLGLAGGVGGFTFWYARGASYLVNDPETCANCHVMQEQFDAWSRGPHHAVAVCNDCHTPHDFAGKWMTKALNGYHHSVAFSTGDFHEPIQIKARNLAVAESSCRHCHEDIVAGIDTFGGAHGGSEPIECTRCHASVGHLQ